MSGFTDLGRALRDDAAVNAPLASVIDVDAVAQSARARRRPRQWAVGTLSVVAALGIGGLALQSVTPPPLIAASESADTATVESTEGSGLLSQPGPPEVGADTRPLSRLACGDAAPEPFADARVGLSVEVAASAPRTGGDIVGVAVLTNTGTQALTLSTPDAATGVLAQGGVVVTAGIDPAGTVQTVPLAVGESVTLPLRVSTTGCGGDALPAGEYVVVVALALTELASGESLVLVATPTTARLD